MTQNSHGRPSAFVPRSKARLDQVPTWDLGCALLSRLERPESHASHMALEANLGLLEALRDAIEPHRDTWQNPFSIQKSAGAFRFSRHCYENHGLPLRGATWVDLGCGAANPFGRLFPVLLLGAKQGICFELEPPRDLRKAIRHLVELTSAALIDPSRLFGEMRVERSALLANIADFDLPLLAKGDPAGAPANRLTLHQRSLSATGLADGSADVLVSNSVLEHISDVDAAITEFARITSVGGFGIHGIDVVDHRSYGDPAIHPLEFLTIASRERIVYECNRLRLCDFEARFTRNGFEVVDAWRGPVRPIPAQLRQRMVEPWRSYHDDQLSITWTEYLVRRR